jgi:hypothetical protein
MKTHAVLLPALAGLLALSGAAQAAWTKIDEQSSSISYVDPDSVQRDKNYSRITAMRDYEEKNKWRSQIVDLEMDCKKKRVRELRVMSYSDRGAKGTGKLAKAETRFGSIRNQGMLPWEPAFRYVCNPGKR